MRPPSFPLKLDLNFLYNSGENYGSCNVGFEPTFFLLFSGERDLKWAVVEALVPRHERDVSAQASICGRGLDGKSPYCPIGHGFDRARP